MVRVFLPFCRPSHVSFIYHPCCRLVVNLVSKIHIEKKKKTTYLSHFSFFVHGLCAQWNLHLGPWIVFYFILFWGERVLKVRIVEYFDHNHIKRTFGMTLWKGLPAYPNPCWPVASSRKLCAILITLSSKSWKTIRPVIGLVSAYARILQFQPIIFAY